MSTGTGRFNRTIQPSNGQEVADNQTPPASRSSGSSTHPTIGTGKANMEANFQALTQRLEQLKSRRARREFELENAERKIEECRQQAQELGVSSLEELEELVKRQKEEDERAMAEFVRALDEEEELLDTIDRRLSEAQGS